MNRKIEQASLHTHTPTVITPFRTLAFLRTPEAPKSPARLLVNRTVTCPLSRTTRLFGARALKHAATGDADAVTVSGLAGQPLCLHTADGDAVLALPDAAGRPLWSRNAQGTVAVLTYEAASAGGRPLSLTEAAAGMRGRVREQYAYAPLGEARWKALNLAGGQVELRDNGGISRPLSVSLSGQPLASEQRLLKPEVELPDWRTTTPADTEAPLKVLGTHDATGAPLTTTHAAGVTAITAYGIDGRVSETRLAYVEQGIAKETVTLRDIHYRADGMVLSQTAGNGVIDRYAYDPSTHYLSRHLTERPAGHPQGALVISDLHYRHDPVGNLLSLEDKGADPAWHNNQHATGLREYRYDTLYRLTRATGRERTPVSRHYAADASAGSVWAPYTEHYHYDDGNNLTTLRHVGGAGNRTCELNVAEGSNRAMVKDHALTPETGFWAGGLQKQLADGRALQWQADNQLGKVTPVRRDEGDDDSERYHYADGGTRTRKLHTVKVRGATQRTITSYAGGCEIRQRWLDGQSTPQKHIVITEGDRLRVVEDRLTGTVHLRYRFSDHLDSVGGETDDGGKLVSREEYAPYGGTVGRDESVEEVSNLTQRTLRYSGKEQDATGLYYYGWRYYQPALGRWLSADPGGLIDGLNLFCFVGNDPIAYKDDTGMVKFSKLSERKRNFVTEATRTIKSYVKTDYFSVGAERYRFREKDSATFPRLLKSLPSFSEGGLEDKHIKKFLPYIMAQAVQAKKEEGQEQFQASRMIRANQPAERSVAGTSRSFANSSDAPAASTGYAITIVWAFENEKIQKRGSEIVDVSAIEKKLKEKNTDPNHHLRKDKWKRTTEGKQKLEQLNSLEGQTYAQLAMTFNDWVQTEAKRFESLFRGVTAEEYELWKSEVGGVYAPQRFVASSTNREVAEAFMGEAGGMIFISNGSGARIPEHYGRDDEQEVLLGTDARFRVTRVDTKKRHVYAQQV